MAYLIACLTATMSFLINNLLLRAVGKSVIISWGPIVEEALKSLLAYSLAADILVTHLVFGAIEGLVDWLYNHKDGYLSASLSVIGHAVFGFVTVSILVYTSSIWLGIWGGITIHLLWNIAVIWLT